MERRRLNHNSIRGGQYFLSEPKLKFVHSGCAILDRVLGGGFPLGRIVNIVGDKSTGKSLLAIEAMSNFAIQYPKGRIRYNESEAAFLPEYAAALGLPIDRVEFVREEKETDTVENFYEDLDGFLKKLKGNSGIYILDSLDALSDEAEMGREFGQDTYGTGKAKQMSGLFRRITRRIETSKVCLIIISQTRDRISGGFGKTYTRSGGRALDFYSSLVIYLAHLGEISRTVGGIKRTIGVRVKAKCTKNKVSLPFRSCTFPIIFSYGIEDVTAGLEWLHEHKRLGDVGMTIKEYQTMVKSTLFLKLPDQEHKELRDKVAAAVRTGWKEVETSFLPLRGKYG
jgi:recombination protein RecA